MATEPTRDFTLNDLPRNEAGEVLFLSNSSKSYYGYIHWLADYLYTAPLIIPEAQRAFCDDIVRHEPSNAMASLGTDAAYYFYDLINACAWSQKERRRFARQRRHAPEAARIQDSLFERIQAEEEKQEALFGRLHEKFADIGWRTPMAVVLKRIHDHEERVATIRHFFWEYADESRK